LENYKKVMDALVEQCAINGIRMPMIPLYENPADYSRVTLHQNVYKYAKQLGMVVFASPMPDTKEGWIQPIDWDDDRFVNFIVTYVKYFSEYGDINVLGPWNEAKLDVNGPKRVGYAERVMPKLRSALSEAGFGDIRIVGPDDERIQSTLKSLEGNAPASLFDIVGSHTQVEDRYGTVEGWTELINMSLGKPVWNTEGVTVNYAVGKNCSNPQYDWIHWCPPGEPRPALKEGVDAGVQAWVHWDITNMLTFKCADGNPCATPEGLDIASNLRA
jgi:hypothetical protein